MDRLELIELIGNLMHECKSSEEIADAILDALTPEDGNECPVCGVCP